MRQKASSAGNLKTTDQVRVESQGQTIIVEPANPQVIYVPYYDPMVVYGPWWWPAYPPVYWAPWPGYFVRPGFVVGFAWGLGIPVGERFFFGTCDWRHRHVTVVNVTNYYYHPVNVSPAQAWEHDPVHRRGVLYRDAAVRQQFRRTSASPETRLDFRGHEPSAFESRRDAGSRPEERGGASGRVAVPDVGRSSQPVPPGRLSAPSGGSPPHGEPRPHAFEGVGQGAAARSFSERGHASAQGAAPQSSSSGGASHGHSGGSGGGGHGGGGGGHGGGSRR